MHHQSYPELPSRSECQRGELQCTSQGCHGNAAHGRPAVPSCWDWQGVPESGNLSTRTRTVPGKPGLWAPYPSSATCYSLSHFQPSQFITRAPPFPSTGVCGLGPGPWERCPLAALPRSSASEWVVRVVTLWALLACWPAGPCLQDCPRGALVSAPSWPLPDLGPLAGFGAAPPSPVSGP